MKNENFKQRSFQVNQQYRSNQQRTQKFLEWGRETFVFGHWQATNRVLKIVRKHAVLNFIFMEIERSKR